MGQKVEYNKDEDTGMLEESRYILELLSRFYTNAKEAQVLEEIYQVDYDLVEEIEDLLDREGGE